MVALMEGTMSYQTILHEIAPDLNPAGVEASMRLQYGTLGHLPRAVFAQEAEVARAMHKADPHALRGIAASMGMADEFQRWEAK